MVLKQIYRKIDLNILLTINVPVLHTTTLRVKYNWLFGVFLRNGWDQWKYVTLWYSQLFGDDLHW